MQRHGFKYLIKNSFARKGQGEPCRRAVGEQEFSQEGRPAERLRGTSLRPAESKSSPRKMVKIITIDPDEGIFEDFKDEVMMNFFVDGVVDLRGIVSDRSAIECDATTYVTGFREIHLMVDECMEPVVLPAITPAEHFSIIVHPVASGLPYDAYLLESREAFHSNKMIGITGISTDSEPNGIDYSIRIVEELKRNENKVEVVSSGWIYGQKQYAMDIVLTHPNIQFSDLLPQRSRHWNFHSRCKLRRWPLVLRQ